MKKLLPILGLSAILFFMYSYFTTDKTTGNTPTKEYNKVAVLEHWIEENESGAYVKLKVKNYADETAKYIGYNIQSVSSDNTVLSSGIGNTTNIEPKQTAIIDRFFSKDEWEGQYKYSLDEITF